MSSLKSKYKILLDHNLVIEHHEGVLDGTSYINFKKELVADPNFRWNLNHLVNFKLVEFATTKKDIENFTNFISSNIQKLGKRKVACVTDTPNQVVSTTIYKTMNTHSDQTIEIFSTKENALKWLNIPELSYSEVQNIILELGNQLK